MAGHVGERLLRDTEDNQLGLGGQGWQLVIRSTRPESPAEVVRDPTQLPGVSPVQVIVRLREFGGFGRGLYVVALKTPSDTESRPPVFPAHSVVHLARHDHGLELLKVLRIWTPTP